MKIGELITKYKHWSDNLTGYQRFMILLNLITLGSVWLVWIAMYEWLSRIYAGFFRAMIVAVLIFGLAANAGELPPPEKPPKDEEAFGCLVALVAVGVGIVLVVGVWKMCKKIDQVSTNRIPEIEGGLILNGGNVGTENGFTIQSAQSLGGQWSGNLRAEFLTGGACVLYENEVAIATNSMPYVTNGTAYYDFRHVRTHPVSTNAGYFRLLSQ